MGEFAEKLRLPEDSRLCLVVLVLAGVELIFFIAATGDGYCVLDLCCKTVLITHQCSSYCWAQLTQSQGSVSASHCTLPENRLGMSKTAGQGTQLGQLTPLPKGYSIPYGVMLSI